MIVKKHNAISVTNPQVKLIGELIAQENPKKSEPTFAGRNSGLETVNIEPFFSDMVKFKDKYLKEILTITYLSTHRHEVTVWNAMVDFLLFFDIHANCIYECSKVEEHPCFTEKYVKNR